MSFQPLRVQWWNSIFCIIHHILSSFRLMYSYSSSLIMGLHLNWLAISFINNIFIPGRIVTFLLIPCHCHYYMFPWWNFSIIYHISSSHMFSPITIMVFPCSSYRLLMFIVFFTPRLSSTFYPEYGHLRFCHVNCENLNIIFSTDKQSLHILSYPLSSLYIMFPFDFMKRFFILFPWCHHHFTTQLLMSSWREVSLLWGDRCCSVIPWYDIT